MGNLPEPLRERPNDRLPAIHKEPSMNTATAAQAKRLLQMIAHSIHGPWPLFSDQDYPHPASGTAPTASTPRTNSLLPLSAHRARLPRRPAFSSIRMQCLRLLHKEGTLTACETAARLDLDWELVQSQFTELHNLRLIERVGTRTVNGHVRPLFQLNPSHPVLDLLLGPQPSREYSARKSRKPNSE